MKPMKKYFLIFIITGLAFSLPHIGHTSKKHVLPTMYAFLDRIMKISPEIYDETIFTSPKKREDVEQTLLELRVLSKKLKQHKGLQTPGYEVTADYFIDNIQQVHESYRDGNRKYAQRLFRSTLHACSHCHTQESSNRNMRWDFSQFQLPKKPIDQASFYYTIRKYAPAWDLFSKVVQTYGKDHKNKKNLETALNRLLTISLRVDRKPQKMVTFLNNLNNKREMLPYFQSLIKSWTKELTNLQKNKNTAQLLEKKAPYFSNAVDLLYRDIFPFPKDGRSGRVVMEYVTGIMFEYVNKHPKNPPQKILYWLGISNLSLDKFESSIIGVKFLEKCIDNYKMTPVSNSCFDALEEHWVLGFSGSSGIKLPIDLQDILRAYRKKLNVEQPWLNY